MKSIISAAFVAALMLGAVPATASECPVDMKKIDAALEAGKGEMLSEDQLAQVKKLRMEGESHHKNGEHAKSVKKLHKAMEMLGIGM